MSTLFRISDSVSSQLGPLAWFPLVFACVAVIVLVGFAYVIYSIVRNRRALRRAGHDPDTIQADLTNRVMRSDLLGSTAQSTEQKLAELDRLHTAGTINTAERDAARAAILAG